MEKMIKSYKKDLAAIEKRIEELKADRNNVLNFERRLEVLNEERYELSQAIFEMEEYLGEVKKREDKRKGAA